MLLSVLSFFSHVLYNWQFIFHMASFLYCFSHVTYHFFMLLKLVKKSFPYPLYCQRRGTTIAIAIVGRALALAILEKLTFDGSPKNLLNFGTPIKFVYCTVQSAKILLLPSKCEIMFVTL